MNKPETVSEKGRPDIRIGLALLFSGAALLLSLYLRVSLAITLLALTLFSTLAIFARWRSEDAHGRSALKETARVGLIAGVVGTAGYDLSRYFPVAATGWHVNPFKAFPLFGQLIIGMDAHAHVLIAVGAVYHLLNGICFATAYCFTLGGRNWKFGIVWGLSLEALMLTVYPGWLDLSAVMGEFTIISFTGHVVYGACIGLIAERGLRGIKSKMAKPAHRSSLPGSSGITA